MTFLSCSGLPNKAGSSPGKEAQVIGWQLRQTTFLSQWILKYRAKRFRTALHFTFCGNCTRSAITSAFCCHKGQGPDWTKAFLTPPDWFFTLIGWQPPSDKLRPAWQSTVTMWVCFEMYKIESVYFRTLMVGAHVLVIPRQKWNWKQHISHPVNI